MEKKLAILMLEDVEEDAELITRSLKRNGIDFECKRVETKEEFTGSIRHEIYDVILSDHSLPQFNSIEALKICRRLGLPVPFILITGTVSEEFAVSCLKQGADDYILKSNLSRLPSAIKNALNQRRLQDQRIKAELELRLQNEELIKINKEMDSFVYSVSHNLRAPLMSVLGLLNLVQREDERRDQHFAGYFNMMNQSILKLDDTLKEILDYSRNARNEIEYARVDIHEIIGSCTEQLKYLKAFENLKIRVTVEGDDLFYTDVYRLKVVLNNLISNAIKYIDVTKTQNLLEIHATMTPKTMWLTLEDNGIGIKKELMPKVFNMFFRATEKSEGAGLGLYIAKETINRLQGKIFVESMYGVGTTFKIELPNYSPQHVNKKNDSLAQPY